MVDQLVQPVLWLKLRQAFTVQGLPFFQLYPAMYRISLGGPVPADIRQQYRKAVNRLNQVRSPLDHRPLSPAALNQIVMVQPLLLRTFRELEQGRAHNPIVWARFNEVFVPLLIEVARDKQVYMRPTRQVGLERWAFFRSMTSKQERVEQLRDDDPWAYALMEKMGQTLEEIDRGILQRIQQEGKEVKETFLAGRPVLIGIDPVTSEERVYDRDGSVLPVEDFFEKTRARRRAHDQLTGRPRTTANLDELRTLPDEDLEGLEGDIEWKALTDDKAKVSRLTRIFPVKRMPRLVFNDETGESRVVEYDVVVEGRYKGIFLDDLVNSEGRLLEGTAFTYDPKANRGMGAPKRIDPSDREPYVTLTQVVEHRTFRKKKVTIKTPKLYLKINGSHQARIFRDTMKKLACNAGTKRGCIPSVVFEPVEGSRAVGVYFDAKDFGVIMDSLQGMSLSASALEHVKSYYKELSQAEQATQNLDAYEAEHLGTETLDGEQFQFIREFTDKEGRTHSFSLREKQKAAIAWLDANGNSGVCGLDTGIGKTNVALGMMLKMVRDGFTEGDSYTRKDGTQVQTNGRFLWVCPKDLKGVIRQEARLMLEEAGVLTSRLDVLSYPQFSGSSRSGKVPRSLQRVPFWKERMRNKGRLASPIKVWDPSLYVAIFFDEAQALRNFNSARAEAALTLEHPRKICLTASPMERNPMEAYVLASVCNNTQLFGRTLEAQNNRQEMRRFKERYCEVVGGRIVGVKQDPMVQRDLHTWIKRNIFYADKTDVKEYNLPTPNVSVHSVVMPEPVESLYRDVAGQFAIILQGAARKFKERSRGNTYADKQAEKLWSRALKPVMLLLNDLANRPDKALHDIAFAVEKGYLPGGEPQLQQSMKSLQALLQKWQQSLNGDELRQQAGILGNPKIRSAQEFLAAKLERAASSRALIFADDKSLCWEAGVHLSRTLAGTHVVALNKSIHILRSGEELHEWLIPLDTDLLQASVKNKGQQQEILARTQGITRHPLPFHQKIYAKHPELPFRKGANTKYAADDWQQFVLKEIVSGDPSIKTVTLLGNNYMFGHNLQAFNTVIHLDRNDWKSESMKQRTARAWRQGQTEVVDEVTIDMAYSADQEGEERSEYDLTLDQIRAVFQDMDSDIFDAIIKEAQGTQLGSEWEDISQRDASFWRLDQKVIEMLSSPYMQNIHSPMGWR